VTPRPPSRKCPACGVVTATYHDFCTECGAEYAPSSASATGGCAEAVIGVVLATALSFVFSGIILATAVTTASSRAAAAVYVACDAIALVLAAWLVLRTRRRIASSVLVAFALGMAGWLTVCSFYFVPQLLSK
jgi:hypothetical protein